MLRLRILRRLFLHLLDRLAACFYFLFIGLKLISQNDKTLAKAPLHVTELFNSSGQATDADKDPLRIP